MIAYALIAFGLGCYGLCAIGGVVALCVRIFGLPEPAPDDDDTAELLAECDAWLEAHR
jgi:hypothetical protein